MDTTKFYSYADLKKIVTWCKGAKLEALLREQGITPAQEVRTAKRVYRVYDTAAIKKAKALAKEHNSSLRDTNPSPAANMSENHATKRLIDEVTGLRNLLAVQNNRMMEHFNRLASDNAQILALLTRSEADTVPSFDDAPTQTTQ